MHYQQFETAKLLVENGANVNAVCGNGWTPLHAASRRGDARLVELLCENGAIVHFYFQEIFVFEFEFIFSFKVDAMESTYATPLALADNHDVSTILLRYGASRSKALLRNGVEVGGCVGLVCLGGFMIIR